MARTVTIEGRNVTITRETPKGPKITYETIVSFAEGGAIAADSARVALALARTDGAYRRQGTAAARRALAPMREALRASLDSVTREALGAEALDPVSE